MNTLINRPKSHSHKKGFTLLEILIVLATLAILATIFILTLDPTNPFERLRDSERSQDLNSYHDAIVLDPTGELKRKLSNEFQEICDDQGNSSDGEDCLNLKGERGALSTGDIEKDPALGETSSGTGYYVRRNPETRETEFYAPLAETETVDINIPSQEQKTVAGLFTTQGTYNAINLDSEDIDGDGEVDAVSIGGEGTAESPYRISDVKQLQTIALYQSTFEDAYISLTQDIDASDSSQWHEGEGFKPIPSFNGVLEGNDMTISNVTVNIPGETHGGLFKSLNSPATVKNLTLDTFDITCEAACGSLAATSQGVIEYVSVENSSVGPRIGGNRKAGLVGTNYGGTIYRSRVVNSSVGGEWFVGGIAGEHYGTIEESYIEGSTVSLSRLGGMLVGNMRADLYDGVLIKNSYASGKLNGSRPDYGNIGGLVAVFGEDGTNNTMESTYARVEHNTTGHPAKGALVGNANSPAENPNPVANSFWDIDVADGLTNTSGGGTPKTTAEMTSIQTFTDTSTSGLDEAWNFSEVWAIDESGTINDGYPYLRWSQED